MIRGADGLAVDHCSAGGGLAPGKFPVFEQQRMVDTRPHAFALPPTQVVVDRLQGREVVRQQPPGASGTQEIVDRVDDLALVGFAGAAAGPGIRDHGGDGGPLGVGQIGGVGAAGRQGVGPGLWRGDAS